MRDAEFVKLPYVAEERFNRAANDPARNISFIYVKRPDYYATFNAGKGHERQNFGLGVVWHPRAGILLQPVAGRRGRSARSRCRSGTDEIVAERGEVKADLEIGGAPTKLKTGRQDLKVGAVNAAYPLKSGGEKTVRFDKLVSRSTSSPPEPSSNSSRW